MDRTIIFESVYSEDGETKTEELVGWYFGRPNEEDTEIFSNGKYKAIF